MYTYSLIIHLNAQYYISQLQLDLKGRKMSFKSVLNVVLYNLSKLCHQRLSNKFKDAADSVGCLHSYSLLTSY